MGATVEGWTKVKLGDIGQSLIGLTYDPSSVKPSGTLVLRSSNIQDGILTFEDNVFVDCAIPDRIRVRDNDILICVRNGSRRLIGKSVMLDRRVAGETFGAFMAVYRSDVNKFLKYFFQSDDFKRQIDEHLGATINQITNGSLNGFVVALPSRTEQLEIASRLMDLDRLIAALGRLIAKREAIKQGMMQELLAGRTRLPGFEARWTTTVVAELAEQHRASLDPHDYPKTVFQHFSLPAFDESEAPVLELGSSIDSQKTRVPTGAVLVSKLNPRIPRIWVTSDLRSNAIASTEFIVLTARQGVDRSYLGWLMKSAPIASRMKLLAVGTTGSHARIHPRQVLALDCLVPELNEQKAIAVVLDDVDAELNRLRVRLTKVRFLKQGMLQQLLTGRTRLLAGEEAS